MHSIAFRLLAEELENVNKNRIRANRRSLRDAANPLELPESLFEKYYRVNKDAFRYLLDVLTTYLQPKKKQFAVFPIVKLSASLRFFAEGGYQTGVGKDADVGLAQSSFSKVLTEVLDIFEAHLCPQWIIMSKSAAEKRKIALAFYEKHLIPGVMGCIDGTHVRIIAPAVNKHLYYNRKGTYSLNVMLVCDNNLRIRYVDATHPGACHDSLIWNTSEIRANLEQEYLRGEENLWLLGDGGYPLEPWLLTPHRVPSEGSSEMKFNEVHSQCRNIIERTNGVLKNRWRCLLGARELYYSPEKAAKITTVCCALHNISIHYKTINDDVALVSNQSEEINFLYDDITSSANARHLVAAQTIRDNIGSNL